jgi:hypothetical protein
VEPKTHSQQDRPRLEAWTIAPAAEKGAVIVMPEGHLDSVRAAATDGPLNLGNLLLLLINELQATRSALADAPSAKTSTDSGTSLRERLLDKQVRELQARVQSMTTEVATLRSEAERKERDRLVREQRERMRSFSD